MSKKTNEMIEGLDKIENTILECQKEFKKNIDNALDGFNDKWLSEKDMKKLIALSYNGLKESEQNLEDIKQMRKEIDELKLTKGE